LRRTVGKILKVLNYLGTNEGILIVNVQQAGGFGIVMSLFSSGRKLLRRCMLIQKILSNEDLLIYWGGKYVLIETKQWTRSTVWPHLL